MKRFVVFLINLFGPSWGILLMAMLFYVSSPLHIIEEWIKATGEKDTFKSIARGYFADKNAQIKGEVDNLKI